MQITECLGWARWGSPGPWSRLGLSPLSAPSQGTVDNVTSKQEHKEAHKASEKKVQAYDKTVKELNEYNVKKMAEEREERLRRKKEIKRAKKKANVEVKSDDKRNEHRY